MLARREPVTLRALVEGTGASTMAVYTHFDGMPGLWRAVRQEGFTRLSTRLARLPSTDDPVRDLAALGAVYAASALAAPALYRTMFDAAFDLEDPRVAATAFDTLVEAASRAHLQGRLAAEVDPRAVATRYWATGHGLLSLVLGGALPEAALDEHAPGAAEALLVAAGDDPVSCHKSVQAGWRAGSTR